ncbi:hypothetical protein J1614_004721 [Plenodomus biglobosus]|nr:hypothetical protein J1614_004721 [Plenodomus biglobosus]
MRLCAKLSRRQDDQARDRQCISPIENGVGREGTLVVFGRKIVSVCICLCGGGGGRFSRAKVAGKVAWCFLDLGSGYGSLGCENVSGNRSAWTRKIGEGAMVGDAAVVVKGVCRACLAELIDRFDSRRLCGVRSVCHGGMQLGTATNDQHIAYYVLA